MAIITTALATSGTPADRLAVSIERFTHEPVLDHDRASGVVSTPLRPAPAPNREHSRCTQTTSRGRRPAKGRIQDDLLVIRVATLVTTTGARAREGANTSQPLFVAPRPGLEPGTCGLTVEHLPAQPIVALAGPRFVAPNQATTGTSSGTEFSALRAQMCEPLRLYLPTVLRFYLQPVACTAGAIEAATALAHDTL